MTERFTNTVVVQKCILYYKYEGVDYAIGTISKEFLLDRLIFAYIFDLDKEAIDRLSKIAPYINDIFIPGIDLELDGYYVAFSKVPYLISSRVADPRRDDIDEILEHFGMKEYDAFTMFLRNKGRSADNFWVEEVNVNA